MIKFKTEQMISPVTKKPIKGATILTILRTITIDRGERALTATYSVIYQDGAPIIIKIRSLAGLTPWTRLASDGASAVQMRRMKKFLGSKFDRLFYFSADDMNSKVNAIIAEELSNEINNSLLGE